MPKVESKRSIKSSVRRSIRALELKPSLGKGTATTVVRLRRGEVASDIYDGDHHIHVDLGSENGGRNEGPDPGILIRGGLGACLAGAYRMWAEYLDIELDDVEVVIEADMDARGMYGVSTDVPPGYLRIRARVQITSDAPEERIREMVELADQRSPLLYDVTTAIEVTRTLAVTSAPVRGV